jgi:hypothetical protein
LENADLPQQYVELAEAVTSQLRFYRAEAADTKELRKAALAPPGGLQNIISTRAVAHELIGRVLKDTPIKLNPNNAIDLSHAVVPVSYCNYVLLDAQWTAMVDDARRRITQAGGAIRLAKVYSKRGNGLDRFLCELESSVPLVWPPEAGS